MALGLHHIKGVIVDTGADTDAAKIPWGCETALADGTTYATSLLWYPYPAGNSAAVSHKDERTARVFAYYAKMLDAKFFACVFSSSMDKYSLSLSFRLLSLLLQSNEAFATSFFAAGGMPKVVQSLQSFGVSYTVFTILLALMLGVDLLTTMKVDAELFPCKVQDVFSDNPATPISRASSIVSDETIESDVSTAAPLTDVSRNTIRRISTQRLLIAGSRDMSKFDISLQQSFRIASDIQDGSLEAVCEHMLEMYAKRSSSESRTPPIWVVRIFSSMNTLMQGNIRDELRGRST